MSAPVDQGGQPAKARIPSEQERNDWKQCIRKWFPHLQTKTYFIPPLHITQEPFEVKSVFGLNVLVPRAIKPTRGKATQVEHRGAPDPVEAGAHVSSRVFTQEKLSAESVTVHTHEEQGDKAEEHVFCCLEKLSDRQGKSEPMVVLSNISFGRHPNKASYAATAVRFGMSEDLFEGHKKGESDVLIISRELGIIFCEIKSVGAYDSDPTTELIRGKAQKAISQLKKADDVITELVKHLNLQPVHITKTIILPFITPGQLKESARNVSAHPEFLKNLCTCVGVGSGDLDAAVERCLCSGQFSSILEPRKVEDDLIGMLETWWSAVTAPGTPMTPDKYEALVSIFCGPATTVELATFRSQGLRTVGEAVAAVGLIISQLTLYPEQVRLVKASLAQKDRMMFLSGPPGTGKSVVLVLAALNWMLQKKNKIFNEVFIISTHKGSRAISFLIKEQLEMSFRKSEGWVLIPKVHLKHYDFGSKMEGIVAEVSALARCAKDGNLFAIIDEAGTARSGRYRYGANFCAFCSQLNAQVKNLRLWAGCMFFCDAKFTEKFAKTQLTRPLRCTPVVTREIKKSRRIGALSATSGIPFSEPYDECVAAHLTEGPEPIALRHKSEDGHTGTHPKDCEKCGQEIANTLRELRIGTENDVPAIQFRDVFVLCETPSDGLPVVKGMRDSEVPVRVVTEDDGDEVFRNMALAEEDVVIVTHWELVASLERRVVIGIGGVQKDTYRSMPYIRPYGMSRCTSLLIWIDPPFKDFGTTDKSKQTAN